MKISAVLILFSFSALANAAAIAPVRATTSVTPEVKVPTPEPQIDYDAITDDVRGGVADTEDLAEDEDIDDDVEEDNDYGFTTRGNVEDTTILERDELPNGLELRESLWERGLAMLERRETAVQATTRLSLKASLSTFLAAKKKKNPKALNWTDDGCSKSPDRPAGFNFLHSCQRHDFGYRNFKKQNRFTKANRLAIDNKLKSDLYNECNKHGIIKRTACKRIADTYYVAVRAAGAL